MEENLMKNLLRHEFKFHSFKTREEFSKFILGDIDRNTSIYFGGSKTVDELGLFESLNEEGYNVNWHWRKDEDSKNKIIGDRKYYITSSNAVSRDGKLINMDGVGNRVSAMITGYDRVYVVVGRNKLVDTVEDGRERIKNTAAPLNAKRLKTKTPCVKTGRCMDCDSEDRICRAEVILHRNPSNSDIVVCLIDEELGY